MILMAPFSAENNTIPKIGAVYMLPSAQSSRCCRVVLSDTGDNNVRTFEICTMYSVYLNSSMFFKFDGVYVSVPIGCQS